MTTQTITLPGGLQLLLPTGGPFGGLPTGIPFIPPAGVAGLPATPDLSGILTALLPALGAASPQLALIVQLLGVVLHIGHAIHTQTQGQPAGANPSLDAVAQSFWQHVTQAFPLPQPQPNAG